MTAGVATINWDQWRAEYPSYTFQDFQDFYRIVADLHPVQESFDLEGANKAFDRIGGDNLNVVELGGWNGKLARDMLSRDDISTWVNYDLISVPQVCDHPRYRMAVLTDYMWARPIIGDVFVACHTIEHLSDAHLVNLLDALDTEWVYLESPLTPEGSDWVGYKGSHALRAGWNDIDEWLERNDYIGEMQDGPHRGLWRRG